MVQKLLFIKRYPRKSLESDKILKKIFFGTLKTNLSVYNCEPKRLWQFYMTLKWLWNRLLAMSLPEIAFRIKEYVQKRIDRLFYVRYRPQLPELTINPSLLPLGGFPYRESDSLKVFDLQFDYYPGFNWHLDISSGKVFPKEFSKGIPLKDQRRGNVKYTWEINRMLFLPNVCLKYRHTNDPKYLHQIKEILESWIDENPYLIGVNWARNIEVSIRLINWSLCWEILGVKELMSKDEDFKSFVNDKWIPSIYLHCKFSYLNPSLFSSANNHLVSEIAALFIATSIWSFPESGQWNRYSKKMLEREMVRQHSTRGVNREEAAGYIQFSTDFFLLSYLFGKNSGNEFSKGYRDILKGVFFYISNLLDVKGHLINYGDDDDGRAFMLESEPHFNNFRSLLTSGAILFQEAALKPLSNGFDSKNEILWGIAGKEMLEGLADKPLKMESQFFVDEGHFLFRKQNGEGQEILMHFDAAPLGYLSIAAHGHADALSLILNVDGCPILLDAGTYTYRSSKVWRNYFIGTLAHNTVRIDGRDQAKSAGPTLWTEHYSTKVTSSVTNQTLDQVSAEHDGYLKNGVKHSRSITFDKKLQCFSIKDNIEIRDQKEHLIEIPWHVGPSVHIERKEPHSFHLKAPSARTVSLKLPSHLPVEIIKGREDPILGWYSTAFEVKYPCEVIYSRLTSDKSLTLEYEITVH